MLFDKWGIGTCNNSSGITYNVRVECQGAHVMEEN